MMLHITWHACWIDYNKHLRSLSRIGKVQDVYSEIKSARPTIIELYNMSMGGTDKFDQSGSYL